MEKILIHCPRYFEVNESIVNELRKKYNVVYTKNSESAADNIVDADILITLRVSPENIKRAKNLKWIQSFSSGVDKFPLEEIYKNRIVLTSAKGIHRVQISEYAILAMLSLVRDLKKIVHNQDAKIWDPMISQDEVYGKTLGILGIGNVGRELAKKAKAFDMKVIGVKKHFEKVDFVDEVFTTKDIEKVLAESDLIVNLLPATAETKLMFSEKLFSKMKRGAYFINLGRGSTVVEDDLISAIKSKHIKGAFLDVFAHEPLNTDSPLWSLDRVIISSHIAGSSPHYVERLFQLFNKNLSLYEEGGELINIVNSKKSY